MPRFKGVHQAFNAAKPYWTKPPKSEAQRKHFARMAAAAAARTAGPVPLGTPIVPPDYDVEPGVNMDIEPEADDFITPEFINDIQRLRIEEEQEERALKLARAAKEMFYAYIECHFQTSEWGDPSKWELDLKPRCDCPPSQYRVRAIDLVDLIYRQKVDVRFCRCQQNDQSRLIYMGYIGGSPMYPETAFSIRLLRFFHVTWKFCTSRVEPWTRGLDEYLDAFNPLILTKNEQPRRWHTPFRFAIDAYRKMLTSTERALDIELALSSREKLAENCPRCFGPPVQSLIEGEPDLIVCLDGNFQHRRHLAAGQKSARITTVMPDGFLPDAQVTRMEQRLAGIADDDIAIDACTNQHTAANDQRGKSHWGGCDETGLMVMVCRHDHPLRFANIVQSGEKLHYSYALIEWFLGMTEEQKVGFLYDIGCTMETGIEKREMFDAERRAGRIRFGTSVFHAYVHRWSCQLQWNPRLNCGWGLSDGEGSERVWSSLDALVSAERYSTKQHRVDSIDMRASHHRTHLRHSAVLHMKRKLAEAIKRLEEASQVLNEIAAVNGAHNVTFFENKWNEQRTRQLDVMTETQNEKRERLKVMLGLEEELIQARDRLKAIQVKRRRARTQADNVQLMSLPDTVANIEEQIEAMANALGGAEFSDLAGATQNQTNALLTLSLARENLYEAKVGLVEARLRRHRQSGARLQQYLAKHLGDKTKNVRVKYSTYLRKVEKYALDYPDAVQPHLPELGDVMAMTMDDPFWNRGEVEPAVGLEADITRLGIENFLSRRSAGEELRRIGREARQMTAWSNMYWSRVVALGRKATEAVGALRNRLQSLYNIVKKQVCKLWKQWGRDLPQQIQETATYIEGQTDQDEILKEEFARVTAWADEEWKTLAAKPIIQAQEPDMYEQAEDLIYDYLYDMNGEML